jgi:alpha-beta hydrolase superfamily lysophospholipase
VRTQFLAVPGGEIACDATGQSPLAVLSHGMGDHRRAHRILAPKLTAAGYRAVNVDMRGHSESDIGSPTITRTDVAGDLLALNHQLGGNPAVKHPRVHFDEGVGGQVEVLGVEL